MSRTGYVVFEVPIQFLDVARHELATVSGGPLPEARFLADGSEYAVALAILRRCRPEQLGELAVTELRQLQRELREQAVRRKLAEPEGLYERPQAPTDVVPMSDVRRETREAVAAAWEGEDFGQA